jgi:hypothetical protein
VEIVSSSGDISESGSSCYDDSSSNENETENLPPDVNSHCSSTTKSGCQSSVLSNTEHLDQLSSVSNVGSNQNASRNDRDMSTMTEKKNENQNLSETSWSYLDGDDVNFFEHRKTMCSKCLNPFVRNTDLCEFSPAYRLSRGVPFKIVKNWVDCGFDEKTIQSKIFDFSLLISGYSEIQLAESDLRKNVLELMHVTSSSQLVRYGFFGFRRLGNINSRRDKNMKLPPLQFCVCCNVRIRSLTIAYKHDISHGISVDKLIAFGLNDPTGKINLYSKEMLSSIDFCIGKTLQDRIAKVRSDAKKFKKNTKQS